MAEETVGTVHTLNVATRDLFTECVRVLEDHLLPIHHEELARRAVQGLGLALSPDEFQVAVEAVRAKLMAEQQGTFFTGPPAFCGALKGWFAQDGQEPEPVMIPSNARAGAAGAFEALMRHHHMQIRRKKWDKPWILIRQRTEGLVLEKHVSFWFEEHYPTFYLPPDNEGKWEEGCNHDFKLSVHDQLLLVDVTGPDMYGKHGLRGNKVPTDIHLICRLDTRHCLFEGMVRGEHYKPELDPKTIFPPKAFLVWLNCEQAELSYASVQPSKSHGKDETNKQQIIARQAVGQLDLIS